MLLSSPKSRKYNLQVKSYTVCMIKEEFQVEAKF